MHGHVATPEKLLLERWGEALSTRQFQAKHVTLDALIDTLAPAAERSFQRLIQALFREGLLNPGTRTYDEHNRCWPFRVLLP